MNLSETLMKHVKLMLDEVSKVSSRYLLSILSHREHLGEGAEYDPTLNRAGGLTCLDPAVAVEYGNSYVV